MKLSSAVWASALLAASPVAAENGLIYFSNSQAVDNAPTSLTPLQARLLIAQRLGLSRFYSLDGASNEDIEVINSYGTKESSDFSSKSIRSPQALILLEGVDNLGAVRDSLATCALPPVVLRQTTPSNANALFLQDLINQDPSIHLIHPLGNESPIFNGEALSKIKTWKTRTLNGQKQENVLFHSTGLERISKESGGKGDAYHSAIATSQNSLKGLLCPQSKNDMTDAMVILMPSKSNGEELGKPGGSNFRAQSVKKSKRQDDMEAGRQDFVPVEAFDDFEKDMPVTQSHPATQFANGVSTLKSNTTFTPPKGILPSCYKTSSSCNSYTNSCSGRGECQLKFRSKQGEGEEGNCWACACQAVREKQPSGGYKVVQWAGPACQKRDVSVPFWLLASTAVGLVTAVAWGIGLLYTMGSQDLPSVIGAGVAGPRPK